MTRGALDAELKTLQDEVSRIVCSSSGEIKLLRTELMAAEEERAAEASQHDRELAHLERQLAVSFYSTQRRPLILFVS